MKSYPSIPTQFASGETYHIFDKLDGSNIRAEWTAKLGFTRFGSRRRVLGETDELWPAATLLRTRFEADLTQQLRQIGAKEATCYFEYFGPNSFAGQHPDSPKDRTAALIDVNVTRKGLLPPDAFMEAFYGIPKPRLLGTHSITDQFAQLVRDGALDGVTFEGVVCKRMVGRKLVMAKIKSQAWLERLRSECETEQEYHRRM